jgi:hypothetical protein
MLRRLAGMILAGGVVLAGAVPVATSASAQTYDPNYPVCMTIRQGGGPHVDCSFTSMQQCNASGGGLAAQCYANPFYANQNKKRP